MGLYDDLEQTADPGVYIAEKSDGYVRYISEDGREWEVYGKCIGLGYCLIGAVIDGHVIETVEEARALIDAGGLFDKDGQPIDSPVAPGFKGCCDFKIVPIRGYDK